MFFDRNNVVHNSTLLLLGFAGSTDGNLSSVEMKVIEKFLINLLHKYNLDINNDGEIDDEDVHELVELVKNHLNSFYFSEEKNFLSENNKTFSSLSIDFTREISFSIIQIKHAIQYQNISKSLSVDILKVINDIASADGKISKEEKRWIDVITSEFNTT